MKLLGTAMAMYVQDYDECYPERSQTWGHFGCVLHRHIKNIGNRQCLSNAAALAASRYGVKQTRRRACLIPPEIAAR
jgi:hypothetical protein